MTATISESKVETQPATAVERPVEFVLSLPHEQKRAVLFALLQEVYAVNGGLTAIPLTQEGVDLGYLVSSREMLTGYQKLMLMLPHEVAEHLDLAIPDDLDLDDCLSEQEVEAINRRVEARYAGESRDVS